jgi:hypothetical protein
MLAGCASEGGTPPVDDGEPTNEDDEVRACTRPSLFVAALPTRACVAVGSKAGRWQAEELFKDGPADVSRFACSFRWASATGARPDVSALRAALGDAAPLAPVCGAAPQASPARVEASETEDGIGPLGGSAGCDVCGMVRGDRVWAVLPPDLAPLRQIRVPLSSGGTKSFKLGPSSSSALVVDLPRLKSGRYVPGHVTVY